VPGRRGRTDAGQRQDAEPAAGPWVRERARSSDQGAAGPVTVQPMTVQPMTVQPMTVQPITVQPVTGSAGEGQARGCPADARVWPAPLVMRCLVRRSS
jgi:hypothetical protein